jgi:hypothetical protein
MMKFHECSRDRQKLFDSLVIFELANVIQIA